MLVVTAAAAGERAGCLVGFATQCSIDPPRFSVWISRKNHSLGVAEQARTLAVHFLSTEDAGLAALFGAETGDEVDKFARCRWREDPEGPPILADCARWFIGEVIDRIPADDHVGFLLAPLRVQSEPWSGQLGFQSARSISPGHEA
jgi:flavin reductase (DIM6/NTAB) family NADH-FMN oxidoreductase RutF